jgi:hypothetical protein
MYRVPASLTLSDTHDSIVIRPARATAADPIMCRQWDLGSPEVRITSTPRNGVDGTYEGPGFTGARTVTMDLVILGDGYGSPYAYAERLASFTHPSRRPTLSIQRPTVDTGGDTWTMSLRGTPFSITYGQRAAAMLEMQLVFAAPEGYLLGPLREFTSTTAAVAVIGGFTLPITLPVAMTPGSGTNPAVTFTITTSAPVAPVLAIYGPVTNPKVATSGGDTFGFRGLSLQPGDFVVVDMQAGTAYLNGDPTSSVFHLIDFANSTFWTWQRGQMSVINKASSGSVKVQFAERRLTI